MSTRVLWFVAAVLAAGLLRAGEYTGTVQSTELYTRPDAAAGGGLRGVIASPDQPLEAVLAVNELDPFKVYRAAPGPGRTFELTGLPAGRYALVVVFRSRFFEGLALAREPDALQAADRASIEATLRRSSPFFDTKRVHRCEGVGGREGAARCMLQEARTRPTLDQKGAVMQGVQVGSLKLAFLERVGPGWQLVRTRELLRREVPPGAPAVLLHAYRPALGGLRVTDHIRDLGTLDLKREPPTGGGTTES